MIKVMALPCGNGYHPPRVSCFIVQVLLFHARSTTHCFLLLFPWIALKVQNLNATSCEFPSPQLVSIKHHWTICHGRKVTLPRASSRIPATEPRQKNQALLGSRKVIERTTLCSCEPQNNGYIQRGQGWGAAANFPPVKSFFPVKSGLNEIMFLIFPCFPNFELIIRFISGGFKKNGRTPKSSIFALGFP